MLGRMRLEVIEVAGRPQTGSMEQCRFRLADAVQGSLRVVVQGSRVAAVEVPFADVVEGWLADPVHASRVVTVR